MSDVMNESEVIALTTVLAINGTSSIRATLRVPTHAKEVDRIKSFALAIGRGVKSPVARRLVSDIGLVGLFASKARQAGMDAGR